MQVLLRLLLSAAPDRERHHRLLAHHESVVGKFLAEVLDDARAHAVHRKDIDVRVALQALEDSVDNRLLALAALLLHLQTARAAISAGMRDAARWARAPGHGNRPPAILTFVSEMTFVRLLDGMALFALMIYLHVAKNL